jgi:Fe-S cluster biosynthesis and repair protein YggX
MHEPVFCNNSACEDLNGVANLTVPKETPSGRYPYHPKRGRKLAQNVSKVAWAIDHG